MCISVKDAYEELQKTYNSQIEDPDHCENSQIDIMHWMLIGIANVSKGSKSFKDLSLKQLIEIAKNEFIEFYGKDLTYEYFKYVNDSKFRELCNSIQSNKQEFIERLKCKLVIQVLKDNREKQLDLNLHITDLKKKV